MGRRVHFREAQLLVALLLALAGCGPRFASSQTQTSGLAATPPCAVTLPNGWPLYSPTWDGAANESASGLHGNGKLWVGLPSDGKLLITPQQDGSLGRKLPWWRAVRGSLTIEGRRLDASAGPLWGHVPEGYGETGFQASGVYFPSEGCWELAGKAGDAELTFVLEVHSQP